VRSGDPLKGAQLPDDDDAMDDLHHRFSLLMDRKWKHGVAAADITPLGRFYERFADHAVEIGRRVSFHATGIVKPLVAWTIVRSPNKVSARLDLVRPTKVVAYARSRPLIHVVVVVDDTLGHSTMSFNGVDSM
jgi:phosphate uptake regulator